MELTAIQQALREAGLDGWLFCDFHHRDPLAYSILGLDMAGMTTRRWFYFIPAAGEPVKLAHRVEPRKLAALPGRQEYFSAWRELHDQLRAIVAGAKRVAMQYSPLNAIPYVATVDAGTVELVRSFGPEIVSAADLVQQFEAVVGAEGWDSHRWAGERVQRIKDEAFERMGSALRAGRAIDEHAVARFILERFEQEGLTSDGDVPIVGFNEHPADPHFEPTERNAKRLSAGDTILVDLWARRREPPGVYYDITWCGCAGEPPADYARIFAVVCRARDAAVDFVRARFAARQACHGYEVDDVARAVVGDAGYGEAFVHRTGHSIGRRVHGNGANIDNLETRDARRLIPGTCFSIEPGIYLAERMAVRAELDVFLTPAGGVEVYGPVQHELIRVG
ncbi:MAG TPA: M24 family metallopeptidase [Candidatus Polarisedimenticolaceae bacterium]|nr:M24 family metallopeptidase [Candidatus Polarisedimenticolaceae bacterium]